ncbi:unnamed protein product [Allacma fusca]|uniref:Uncharacterized protein n=1 Tax=Allacma fusca TaxID=39272 RepID=A0A8J2K6J7_9HEXA|nr:unnamed protein product [Allacma fusca]
MACSSWVLAILAVISFASQKALVNGESSWECFKFVNTIEPGTPGLGSWTSANWTTLINDRTQVSNRTLDNCKKQYYKPTVTILVATEEDLRRTFPTAPPNLKGKTMWSRDIFRTYTITNKGGNRTAYDCGNLFCKVKLGKDNRPTRLEGVNYKTGLFTGSINLKSCKKI